MRVVVGRLAIFRPAQRHIARLLLGIPGEQSATVQGDVGAHVLPQPPRISVVLKLRRSGATGLCVPERDSVHERQDEFKSGHAKAAVVHGFCHLVGMRHFITCS